MADTYSYISTSYGMTNLAAADWYVISNSAPASNPDIELRMSVAGWTGSPAVPTDAELKQVILLALQRMVDALEMRTISTAGINLLTS